MKRVNLGFVLSLCFISIYLNPSIQAKVTSQRTEQIGQYMQSKGNIGYNGSVYVLESTTRQFNNDILTKLNIPYAYSLFENTETNQFYVDDEKDEEIDAKNTKEKIRKPSFSEMAKK